MNSSNSSINSTKYVLSVRGLKKSYGTVEVLHHVDLDITPGERVALMGRSGSGKSTLLNCICGIEPFDAGEIVINDKYLSKLGHAGLEQLRRKQIGYVFQTFHLLPTLTALENVEFPAQLIGMSVKERRSRALDLLKLVGMEHRKDHRPAMLSGGERQRVALARSVINRPRLILTDEPTGNLDSSNSARVLELIQRVSIESSIAVLLVTHDSENTFICDRSVHMHDGSIEGDAP